MKRSVIRAVQRKVTPDSAVLHPGYDTTSAGTTSLFRTIARFRGDDVICESHLIERHSRAGGSLVSLFNSRLKPLLRFVFPRPLYLVTRNWRLRRQALGVMRAAHNIGYIMQLVDLVHHPVKLLQVLCLDGNGYACQLFVFIGQRV